MTGDTRRGRGRRPAGARERPSSTKASISAEGIVARKRPVAEAIRAGIATEVMVSLDATRTQGMREVEQAAVAAGVILRALPRAELDALSPDHQGVVARVRSAPGRSLSERDLAEHPFSEDAIVVILDGVTDPQNLGAAARSAEAAGTSMLVTRTRRAADVTPAAIRASAGALLHIPHARVANISRAIDRLKDAGFTVVGLVGEASQSIYDRACPQGRVAVVVGSEDEGISRLVRERCDLVVSVPMLGRVASLNASASLAAALYGFVLASRALGESR